MELLYFNFFAENTDNLNSRKFIFLTRPGLTHRLERNEPQRNEEHKGKRVSKIFCVSPMGIAVCTSMKSKTWRYLGKYEI
jgi:hypothetical protein